MSTRRRSSPSPPGRQSSGDSPATLVEIAARIRAGEEAAAAELVRRFRPGLSVVLRRRCRDDGAAEDLVQDTLLLALQKIRRGEVEDPERLAGFIHGTARNLYLNYRRKAGRLVELAGEHPGPDLKLVEPRSDHLDTLLRREESRLVRELLAEMPNPRDRQILVRFYLSQEPKEAICTDLDIDPGHFRRVLYRARERLREQWRRHGDAQPESAVGQ